MHSEIQQLSKTNISGGWLEWCHPTLCWQALGEGAALKAKDSSIYQVTAKKNCPAHLAAWPSTWLPGEKLTPQRQPVQKSEIL